MVLHDANSMAANKLKNAMGFMGLPSLIGTLFCSCLDFMHTLFITFVAS